MADSTKAAVAAYGKPTRGVGLDFFLLFFPFRRSPSGTGQLFLDKLDRQSENRIIQHF